MGEGAARLILLLLLVVSVAVGVGAVTARTDSVRVMGFMLSAALIVSGLLWLAPIILSDEATR